MLWSVTTTTFERGPKCSNFAIYLYIYYLPIYILPIYLYIYILYTK
eukprot:SAG11_NODE_103_length_16571_cov_49.569208_1_plen_46_part_00